jgi:hypothetical protein
MGYVSGVQCSVARNKGSIRDTKYKENQSLIKGLAEPF